MSRQMPQVGTVQAHALLDGMAHMTVSSRYQSRTLTDQSRIRRRWALPRRMRIWAAWRAVLMTPPPRRNISLGQLTPTLRRYRR